MFKKALGTSIVGLGLAMGGNAQALVHDYNGAAAGGVVDSSIWDWTPGNALFLGLAPIPASPGTVSGTLLLQGSFAVNGNGSDFDDTWTYQASVPITATIVASGASIDFGLYGNTGGTFAIYYDAAADHEDIGGTGYSNGTLIYTATLLSGSLGSLNVNSTITGDLDQFGANNQPGVTTGDITGNVTFALDTTFEDIAFFGIQSTSDEQGVGGATGDGIADVGFTTDSVAAFFNANPSDLVVNVAPNYDGAGLTGLNDNACTAAVNCDIHVETDARSPIPASIPEPTTVALVGLGLAGLGMRRRRNRV